MAVRWIGLLCICIGMAECDTEAGAQLSQEPDRLSAHDCCEFLLFFRLSIIIPVFLWVFFVVVQTVCSLEWRK